MSWKPGWNGRGDEGSPLLAFVGFAVVAGILISLVASWTDWLAQPTLPRPSVAPLSEVTVDPAVDGDHAFNVKARLAVSGGERVRGWFTLSPPGTTEQWRNFEFKSRLVERVIPSSSAEELRWSDPAGGRDGIYEIHFWLERMTDSGWQPLGDGSFNAPLVSISGHGSSFQQIYGGGPAVKLSKVRNSVGRLAFDILVTTSAPLAGVSANWELRPSDSPASVPAFASTLNLAPTDEPSGMTASVDQELQLRAGDYDLWVNVTPEGDTAGQTARYRHAFVETRTNLVTRARPPVGPLIWDSEALAAPLALNAAKPSLVPLHLQASSGSARCIAYWVLRDRLGSPVASGATRCDRPSLILPSLSPGAYQLDLSAYVQTEDGSSAALSDEITLAATVAS